MRRKLMWVVHFCVCVGKGSIGAVFVCIFSDIYCLLRKRYTSVAKFLRIQSSGTLITLSTVLPKMLLCKIKLQNMSMDPEDIGTKNVGYDFYLLDPRETYQYLLIRITS